MKRHFLLPHYFKKIGWLFILAALVLWFCSEILQMDLLFLEWAVPSIFTQSSLQKNGSAGWFVLTHQDMTYTLFSSLLIAGGLLLLFARERV